jgi:hypothetical protein
VKEDTFTQLFKAHARPEAKIQKAIIEMLTLKGWFVKITIGSTAQQGFPDLFCCHSRYGIKLVEVKNAEGYRFTDAQLQDFPKLCANGAGVWILTAATEEEYNKLFRPPNWYQYLAVGKL